MLFVEVHILRIEPVKRVTDRDAAPTHVADREIGAVEQALVAEGFNNRLKGPGLSYSARIEPDIVQATQAGDTLNGVPGVEATGGVSQNQAHVGVALTVAADGRLVDWIGQSSIAHHVERNAQPLLVSDPHMLLR